MGQDRQAPLRVLDPARSQTAQQQAVLPARQGTNENGAQSSEPPPDGRYGESTPSLHHHRPLVRKGRSRKGASANIASDDKEKGPQLMLYPVCCRGRLT